MAYKSMLFGDRLRQIRKERGMTQEQLAEILGTSKQVLSRYEKNQRAPKITVATDYAEKLGIDVEYLLGDTEEAVNFQELSLNKERKPFYKIFMDVTWHQGLDIPGIVRTTGLTDNQVRWIIARQMKDAPLPLALLLTEKLGVPLEVWAGAKGYKPLEISPNARAVAFAYDKADAKSRSIVCTLLDLPPEKDFDPNLAATDSSLI